jgi:hypothetical protein
MEFKHYANIVLWVDLNIESKSFFVKLTKKDLQNIYKEMKHLRKAKPVSLVPFYHSRYSIEIFANNICVLRIINNYIISINNTCKAVLLDNENKIRDIIFDNALDNNFDEASALLRLLLDTNKSLRVKLRNNWNKNSHRFVIGEYNNAFQNNYDY